jgi:hypothetical protein
MPGLRVGDDELRTLLVRRLEIMSDADFEKARRTAARLKVPLETTLVERARIPMGFLLEHLTQASGSSAARDACSATGRASGAGSVSTSSSRSTRPRAN